MTENNLSKLHVGHIPQTHTVFFSSAHILSTAYAPSYFWSHSATWFHWSMKPIAEPTFICGICDKVEKSGPPHFQAV